MKSRFAVGRENWTKLPKCLDEMTPEEIGVILNSEYNNLLSRQEKIDFTQYEN